MLLSQVALQGCHSQLVDKLMQSLQDELQSLQDDNKLLEQLVTSLLSSTIL